MPKPPNGRSTNWTSAPRFASQSTSADSGNIITRLTRAVDVQAARERFAASIARIRTPGAGSRRSRSSQRRRLSFASMGWSSRGRSMTPDAGFIPQSASRLFSASAPAEYVLDENSEAFFGELVQRIAQQRQPGGSHTNLFFRLAPERWLESLITRDVRAIDERLDGRFVYSQVPAFAAADRAMLDVLTCTLEGGLAVSGAEGE